MSEAKTASKTALDQHSETLETLAVTTLMELMSDDSIDPKIRLEASSTSLKALGKDAPAKSSSGTQITLNFGSGLTKALSGMGQFQSLLERDAPDQQTVFRPEAASAP